MMRVIALGGKYNRESALTAGRQGHREGSPGGEKALWEVFGKVEKWGDEGLYRAGTDPFEVVTFEDNVLLNEGIGVLLDRLITANASITSTPFDNTNARIGVGDQTTAEAATQTGLNPASNAGANSLFKGMVAGYPARSGTKVTFRAEFLGTEANFAWNEWTVDNGATANINLNRRVVALGTKASGSTWTFTVDFTIS